MLAWKDTRESRRAVTDALPFLNEATEVLVAEVCEPGSETESPRSVEDVAVHLRRHGVSVGAKAFLRSERSVVDELLYFAKDGNADLHCRRRLRAQPIRRVDVRRSHAGVGSEEPTLLPVLALRRKREGSLTMTQTPQSSQAWPDGNARGRESGWGISLSWMRRRSIHDPRCDERNGCGHPG